MAKRFADTQLTREQWYRKLRPEFKAAWRYLCDECDCVGSWSIDLDSMNFHVGTPIDLEAFLEAVNSDGKKRVIRINGTRLLITGFVSFQYGSLSPDCKPHLKVISRLKELTLWEGYTKGFQTLEEEEEEKEKEEEEEEEEEEARTEFKNSDIAEVKTEWLATLKHFGITRDLGMRDEVELGRAVQSFGIDWVRLALLGARKQKPGKNFDPAQFVSLRIYFDPKRIERLVNIGAGKESAEGIDWGAVFKDGAA